jgi:hypothetical protein
MPPAGQRSPSDRHGSGLGGTLRAIAIVALTLIAALALLLIFELLPREAFSALSTKVALGAMVVAALCCAIAALLRIR